MSTSGIGSVLGVGDLSLDSEHSIGADPGNARDPPVKGSLGAGGAEAPPVGKSHDAGGAKTPPIPSLDAGGAEAPPVASLGAEGTGGPFVVGSLDAGGFLRSPDVVAGPVLKRGFCLPLGGGRLSRLFITCLPRSTLGWLRRRTSHAGLFAGGMAHNAVLLCCARARFVANCTAAIAVLAAVNCVEAVGLDMAPLQALVALQGACGEKIYPHGSSTRY